MTARRNLSGPLVADDDDECIAAYHEAGHGCTAIDQRIKFKKIFIRDGNRGSIVLNGREQDEFIWQLRLDRTDPSAVNWAERMIVVLFAGAAAERRHCPKSDWRSGMQSDLRSVDRWLHRMKAEPFRETERVVRPGIIPFIDKDDPILDQKVLDACHTKFNARAVALVRKLRPEIQIVAAALLKKKILTRAEVRRLMAR